MGVRPRPVVWSWGRSEPPAPASPALPARMDALTQFLALCCCELQPGMKTRAGAAWMEMGELLGLVFHTGLEAEPSQPLPKQYKTTQGIPGGVNRAGLS